MKKNRMMRLASVLLVLTLLSTSVISGTFAKYVTTGSVSDTARVAKFGVVISTSGTLYSNAYVKESAGNIPATAWSTTYADPNNITVATESVGTDRLVAPGTESYGSGLTFGISGTPEVATQVDATIKARDIYLAAGDYGVMVKATVTHDNFEALKDNLYTESSGTYTKLGVGATYDGSTPYYVVKDVCAFASTDYYPVQYKLTNGTGTPTTGKTEDVAKALLGKIAGADYATDFQAIPETDGITTTYKKKDTGTLKVFNANTNLATNGPILSSANLTWEWVFGDDVNNTRDTILGDMMAACDGSTVGYTVVYKDSDKYEAVVYNNSDKLVTKKGSTTIIASLQTSFDITLTVSQVD